MCEAQKSSPRGDSEITTMNKSRDAAPEGRKPLWNRGLGMILGTVAQLGEHHVRKAFRRQNVTY
jgi:hypothetical protein